MTTNSTKSLFWKPPGANDLMLKLLLTEEQFLLSATLLLRLGRALKQAPQSVSARRGKMRLRWSTGTVAEIDTACQLTWSGPGLKVRCIVERQAAKLRALNPRESRYAFERILAALAAEAAAPKHDEEDDDDLAQRYGLNDAQIYLAAALGRRLRFTSLRLRPGHVEISSEDGRKVRIMGDGGLSWPHQDSRDFRMSAEAAAASIRRGLTPGGVVAQGAELDDLALREFHGGLPAPQTDGDAERRRRLIEEGN